MSKLKCYLNLLIMYCPIISNRENWKLLFTFNQYFANLSILSDNQSQIVAFPLSMKTIHISDYIHFSPLNCLNC